MLQISIVPHANLLIMFITQLELEPRKVHLIFLKDLSKLFLECTIHLQFIDLEEKRN